MASSEQQDILDGVVHIYECDEQHVSVLIMPTDGEVRENLPISIEDAESDTVYTTTTTDAYGMINTTLSLSSGTYVPIIKCGNNIKNIYEGGVVCHACSLTLTSDKDILSAADGDIATLTATLTGTESGYDGPLSGREVAFEIYQASDNTFIETLTATTNSSGVATVSYSSQGIGDISITAKVGSLVTESFVVQDIYLYDELTSSKHSWKNTNLTSNYSYSSNGMTVTANGNGAILVLDETLPSTYSAEVTITGLSPSSASKGGGLLAENTAIQPNNSNCTIMKLGSGASWFDISEVLNVNDVIKLIYDGTKVEYYKGTTKLGEIAKGNGANVGFGIRNLKPVNNSTDSITIKDLKIRSL